MNELLREVALALKRLTKSDTPVKRRNARTAYRKASRQLDREVDLTYRPMRDDGTEVAKTKVKGIACPYCKVPFQQTNQLYNHLQVKHGWSKLKYTCACGKHCKSRTQMLRHLRAVDLPTHLVKAELLAQAPKEEEVRPW